MVPGHFISRDTWRQLPEIPKGEFESTRTLDEAYFSFANELGTNQKLVCYNCRYEDFINDDAVYYYLVFGDFVDDEPKGFDCPNCGGPMTTL